MANWLKTVLQIPIDTLLLVSGIVFVSLSFDPIRYHNEQWDFIIKPTPNWILLFVGIVILGLFFWRNHKQPFLDASIDKIKDGSRLIFDSNHAISIITGRIEDFKGNEHSAVVLPANTSFDDKCIRDKQSALGSFFLRHFPNGIVDIQRLIMDAAITACGKTEQPFKSAPPGTTIMLDNPFGSSFRIMITAITIIDPEHGIIADTLSLISSVKQVFRLASLNRISSLTLPVMGTGHGGLDFKVALSLLLVQCMYSMQHEGAHHVRNVTIVVFDPENRKQDIIAKVVRSVGNLTQI
jgi:hypothetical protein